MIVDTPLHGDIIINEGVASRKLQDFFEELEREINSINQVVSGVGITAGTSVDLNGVAFHDFTGIPSGVVKVTIAFFDTFLGAVASAPAFQLGPAAGPEVTGYAGGFSRINFPVISFDIGFTNAVNFTFDSGWSTTNMVHGEITFYLTSTNTWVCRGQLHLSNTSQSNILTGRKALAGELTQIRMTTASGSPLYGAGSTARIFFE